jgi:FMN phosphatase YigB (HAD superfamily)
MTLAVRWMGIDMGECLMDVTPRRGHALAADTTKLIREPELSEQRIHRWRVLKEKYGSVPVVLERHKTELIEYVFDGHEEAAKAFLKVEQDYLELAPGAKEALEYLRNRGMRLSVVTAAKSTLGPIETATEVRFLQKHDVLQYFDEVVTPQGRLRLSDGAVDERYRGTSKEEGTIYDALVEDLAAIGIGPSEGLMMGDKEWTDITPAKKRGLKTILYAGYVCRGPTAADAVVHRFSELKEIVRFKSSVS